MLTSIALIFLSGMLLGNIFKKLKLPALIGMLIAGILLGPHVFYLLDDSLLAISSDLRQIALVIILIRAGLSLEVEDLKKIGRPAVLMSFVPACFEMAATIFIAPKLLGLSLLDSALLAAVIASASPAVIVPRMLHLMETGYGTDKRIPQLVLAGDSVDDIFNIVVFSTLLGVAKGENISILKAVNIPISIMIGIIVGVATGFLLVKVFQRFRMRDSVKILILLSIAFLLLALEGKIEESIPFSALLAVMTAGVVILQKRPKVAKRISGKLSKMWVAAEILLFVLVGASVHIGYVAEAGIKAIFIFVFVLSIRAVGIFICLLKTDLNKKERLFCIFTGIPKATVQAAIGGIPLAAGIASGEIILAVAVLAILFTAPVGAFILDISYKKLLKQQKNKRN